MCSTGLLIAETAIVLHQNSTTNMLNTSDLVIDNSNDIKINESNGSEHYDNNNNPQQQQQQYGLIAMFEKTLGYNAKLISSILYIFIHYSLLVAYIAEAGSVLNETIFSSLLNQFHWSPILGQIVFTFLLGYIFCFTSISVVETINNLFVLIILLSFSSLILIGLPLVVDNITPQMNSGTNEISLFHQDYHQLLPALPIMLLALVYHNIVPTVCHQLQYDKKSIITSISLGTLIPLIMFIVWNFLILELVPLDVITQSGSTSSSSGGSNLIDPVNVLITSYTSSTMSSTVTTNTLPPSLSSSTSLSSMTEIFDFFQHLILSIKTNVFNIPTLISVFSEAAIVTSFIGFVFGIKDFFIDLFPTVFQRHEYDQHNLQQNNNKIVTTERSIIDTENMNNREDNVLSPFSITSNAYNNNDSSNSNNNMNKSNKVFNSDVFLYSIILIPPMLISISFPDIFTKALSFAGT